MTMAEENRSTRTKICHYSVFWVITPRKVVLNRRFGTTCRTNHEGSSCIIRQLDRFLHNRSLPPRLNWIILYSGLLRGLRWFKTNVSALSVQSSRVKLSKKTDWPLNIGHTNSPETSVSNHLTQNPRRQPATTQNLSLRHSIQQKLHVRLPGIELGTPRDPRGHSVATAVWLYPVRILFSTSESPQPCGPDHQCRRT